MKNVEPDHVMIDELEMGPVSERDQLNQMRNKPTFAFDLVASSAFRISPTAFQYAK